MSKSQENIVEIKCSAIQSIKFIENSLVITPEQPNSLPPDISNSGDIWTIDLNCGRKGDKSVAEKFTNISGGGAHVFSPNSTKDENPSQLNFYFGILVEFNLEGKKYMMNLYLGQGHQVRNNWWIGGNFVFQGKGSCILCIVSLPDGMIEMIYKIKGGVSGFELNSWLN
ncbi:hypothetical protein L1994_05795 [Methanomicrobium antiquum]|uniref:Uncharacterized protein n=1 Tax=Methanomicrobium antiquum TaxID=487686 RepID=A0AAF0G0P2_9EURY|nr:hypothetical protein [Methanomicrobium antiquum]WFN37894.1 hypothetical protein L1994_05795 [Methanomicrobium antiquum]